MAIRPLPFGFGGDCQTAHKGAHGPETSLEHDAEALERAYQSQNCACGPAHGANAG